MKHDVVDKNVHGVKMTSKKHESRLKAENEWNEMAKPSAVKYDVKDSVT